LAEIILRVSTVVQVACIDKPATLSAFKDYSAKCAWLFCASLCDLFKCCFRPPLAETHRGVKFSAACRHTTLPIWPCILAQS